MGHESLHKNGRVTIKNLDNRSNHDYFMGYETTIGIIIYWNLYQTFVIRIAHHAWFDEHNYCLSKEYTHIPSYLLLQQDPQSLHHNMDLINLIPCELDLTYITYKTNSVKTMIYDPSQPINIIFKSIDDLVEYARAAEAELNQNQTINLPLVFLNKQRIFNNDTRAWKRTNHAYKTWINFKHDLCEDHLELRETGGTIDELGFHNANAIVDQMMARLQVDKDKCAATSTKHATSLASTNQANATMG